jgi:DNA-binding transcriptional LysR family regulator
MQLPSNEAVRTAVMVGATAILELVVDADIRAGLLIRIDLDLPLRPFYVLHHRSRYRSKAGTALLEMIEEDRRPAPESIRQPVTKTASRSKFPTVPEASGRGRMCA